MTTTHAALLEASRKALDALEQLQGGCTDSDDGTVEAITVWCPEIVEELRAALAQAEAAQPDVDEPAPRPVSLRDELQMQCSAWGTYWRASDAHGVELTHEQALELLRMALGVEVDFKKTEVAQPVAPQWKLLEDGKTAIPANWTWCRIEHEPGYPEDVAFGPPHLMEKLKGQLQRYYALYAAAPQPAEAAQPVQRNNPLSALAIRLLVKAGHVSQEQADEAFGVACRAVEAEAQRMNVSLPWVVAAPQPAEAAQPVVGWRLVPVEPTDEMVDATHHGQPVDDIYRDMLAAAPRPLEAAPTGPLDDFGRPIVYDTEAVDNVTHALTGDEGEDDSVTVLERFASYVQNVWPGKPALQVLIEYEEKLIAEAAPKQEAVAWDWLRGVMDGIPTREERIGGQRQQYVAKEAVMGWIEEGQSRAKRASAQPQQPAPEPVAWLCELAQEDGSTRAQIVTENPDGLRWNDAGEPSPFRVTPLYAAPQPPEAR